MFIDKSYAKLEELLPVYNAFVFNKKSFNDLRQVSLQSKAGVLKVRSFCWKVIYRLTIALLRHYT